MNTQYSRHTADDVENKNYFSSEEESSLAEKELHSSDAVSLAQPRPFASETPGSQMKAIREAQKVSVEEVAKRLYLDVQMIRNLEADNYAHLPPPIFVQGYLRAFAKLFSVSEEPLLAAYVKYNPNAHTPPPLASENTAQMPRVGVGHASGRWWFYATWVLLLALTALVAWRYTMQPPSPANDAPTIEPSATIAPAPPSSSASNPPLYIPPSEGGGTKQPPPVSSSTPVTPTPPPVSTTPLAPPPVAMIGLPPAPVVTPPSISPPATSSPSTQSDNGASGTVPTPPAPSENVSGLVLKFKDVSWARVIDSKKKKLHDGTSRPGQTVEVKGGVPPYEVSFNKPATVEMFYNGQLMDLSEYKNKRTATLSVGDPPAGTPEEDEEE